MRFLPRLVSLLGLLTGWMAAGDALDITATKELSLRTHSLQAPYLDADRQNRWFDFGGDTIIRENQYVRLVGELPSQAGWIFSKVPLTATNWEIEIVFRIHGKSNLHGDGMALFLTTERAQEGPVFGFKDKFEGLAIFFDTYKNNRPGVIFPYVMAMVGDGKTSYNKNNDGMDQELAGCSARGIRNSDQVTKARLTHWQDHSLNLSLSYKSTEEWTECFSTGPVTIPSVTYLGLSAETGELADNFDIISISTKNLYSYGTGPNHQDNVHETPSQDQHYLNDARYAGKKGGKGKVSSAEAAWHSQQNESGGFFKWMFRTFILLFVLGLGYVGRIIYRMYSRQNKFD